MDDQSPGRLALTVRDVDATCTFYGRALGVRTLTSAEGRKALQFGPQEIDLHPEGQAIDPQKGRPIPGSADLRFLTPTPLAEVIDHLGRVGIPIEAGPVDRAGPEGPTRSITLRDPDGNLIEVSNRAEV